MIKACFLRVSVLVAGAISEDFKLTVKYAGTGFIDEGLYINK